MPSAPLPSHATAGLLSTVRACTFCSGLPLGPRPILQWDPAARVLIAGQAPGRITHEKGVPFDDPSGDRLRQWLGVDRTTFYDPALFAIVPMGFCFPGTGKSGDLPPRPECAPLWRLRLIEPLVRLDLTIIIGQFASDWHAPGGPKTLTERVRAWRDDWPHRLTLPHPSPRNNRWLARNHWFEAEIVPALRDRIAQITHATGNNAG